MATVYLAQDLRLGRRVALKLLSSEWARRPDAFHRFEKEARALAALNHPNVVTLYSVEEEGGERFLTMELVDGKTLGALIPSTGLELDQLLSWSVPLVDALSAAHERGIVHRDLKPSNVMIAADGRVKVLDFGLATISSALEMDGISDAVTLEKSREGRLVGTLSYMSPEQVEGKAVDQRSDLFSLGGVLYEMATGRKAFDGESPAAIVAAILREEPAPPMAFDRRLPGALTALIRRCLEKDPGRRPPTAASVRAALSEIAAGAAAASPLPGPARRSVAVLPFADMSPSKDQEYFCDGVAEEIRSALARLQGLDVTARTSSSAFQGQLIDIREIGRKLGVDTILEGGVRRAHDRLRVTAQLIDVADGYHLWSERFDRDAADVFAIQDEIALAVVENLKVKLLANERGALLERRTSNRDAYRQFHEGRFRLNRRHPGDLERALSLFEGAIASDPGYVLPYVAIANALIVVGVWGFARPGDVFPRARAMTEKALAIGPELAEAHLAMALVHHLYDRDPARAEHHFQRAFSHELRDPMAYEWYALHRLIRGRPGEALAVAEQGLELDPLSAIAHTIGAAAHVGAGRADTAVSWLLRALEIDPDLPAAHHWLGWCYASMGRDEEALPLARKAASAGLPASTGLLGFVLARSGEVGEAREILAALDERERAGGDYVSPFARALVAAGLDDEATFLARIDEARRDHEPVLAIVASSSEVLSGILTTEQIAEVIRRR